MGQSKKKGVVAFADVAMRVLDRAIDADYRFFSHGAFLDLNGDFYRHLVLAGAEPANLPKYRTYITDLRSALRGSEQVLLSNVPLTLGSMGSLVSPGVAPHEFSSFREFCRQMEQPSWMEYTVGDRVTGYLVRTDGRLAFAHEIRGDMAHRSMTIYPYALTFDWDAPGSLARSIHDPTGTYDAVSRREAADAGLRDCSEMDRMLMMTRESDVLPMACVAAGFEGTVAEVLPAPSFGVGRLRVRMGRSQGNDTRREMDGLPPWP